MNASFPLFSDGVMAALAIGCMASAVVYLYICWLNWVTR